MSIQTIDSSVISQLVEIATNQRNYSPVTIRCNSIVAKNRHGEVVSWLKPNWGRMTLEHDGYRTVVKKFNWFSFPVGTYITYDLVSIETD
jgi:hypothetical protein